MATAQSTKNNITLRGSTAIVTEFFGYAVNSILYQRGIYPPETFERKQKYGLGMLVTTDESLKAYLVNVLQQINDWMMQKMLQKLRRHHRRGQQGGARALGVRHRTGEGRQRGRHRHRRETREGDHRGDLRHHPADPRVGPFLPLLEEACTFDLLVYTNTESAVPKEWEESDARYIASNAEQVKLRSFSTSVHKVEGMVS